MPRLVRAPAIAAILAFAGSPGATRAGAPSLQLKPGQALTFAVTVTDGTVTLGPGRLARPGAGEPKDGEVDRQRGQARALALRRP